MWKGKKVSVVFPTYKEKKSILLAIKSIDSQFVDEIIVVDNNAERGTAEEVKKTRAKLIKETSQGYGYAVRKGIKSAKGDLIIISEPDGSFDGNDVVKLLAYSDDFDMVFGSRTHVRLNQEGSDMNLVKRYGDVFLGRLITLLFLGPPLTDLSCSYRLTNRAGWKAIEKECKATDALMATEWVILAAKNNIRFIEVPINFKARVGKSTTANNVVEKIVFWGFRKFFYIWKVWILSLFGRKLYS